MFTEREVMVRYSYYYTCSRGCHSTRSGDTAAAPAGVDAMAVLRGTSAEPPSSQVDLLFAIPTGNKIEPEDEGSTQDESNVDVQFSGTFTIIYEYRGGRG